MYWFCLPYIRDGATDDVLHAVQKHVVCSRGLLLILDFGARRWRAIRNASTVSGVFPQHKGIGKINYNSIQLDKTRLVPLTRCFKHLMKLGEVRATRSVATLVDGMLGHLAMPIGMSMMMRFTFQCTWVTAFATIGTWHHWVILCGVTQSVHLL